MAFDGGPITSTDPPRASLHSTFCSPFLSWIRRPTSNIWFKTPAMVSLLNSMFSRSSRVVISWRRTPLLDRLRGPFQRDIPASGDLR